MRHFVFFFNDTATTEIYTLSLHDALPILFDFVGSHQTLDLAAEVAGRGGAIVVIGAGGGRLCLTAEIGTGRLPDREVSRSEEHTSELQSRQYLVCRLLLEKKNSNSSSSLR